MVFKRAIAGLALLVAAACQSGGGGSLQAADASGLPTVVKLDSGYVYGLNGPVRSYKGIPYAAPPVGALRWKPAQPVAHWEGVKPAVSYGPQCIQGRGSPSQSEDCLSLNVWTAASSASAKLPVYVWIHGGAYVSGAGSLPSYDGTALASQGIVVVSINYRLGIFGFFAHPELSAENPEHVSGNQAVTDMIQSLQWVKANIAAFGGDPSNVTIGGESAGGTSMGLLLISPKANGLFSKAVAESPWGFFQPTGHLTKTWYGKKPAEQVGAALGKLADLRAKAAADAAVMPRAAGGVGANTNQVVDGVIIPDDPTVLLQKGRLNAAKLIVGTNRDEGTIFARPAATLADAKAAAVTGNGPGGDALVAIYGGTSDATAEQANLAISRDSLFTMGARELARSVTQKSQAWQYEFTRVSGAGERSKLGAFHGAEMPYFFRNLPDTPYVAARVQPLGANDFTAADEKLSAGMSGYLLNFIKTGDPNGAGLAPWPKYAGGKEPYMEFSVDGFTVRNDLRKTELDALRTHYLAQFDKRGE